MGSEQMIVLPTELTARFRYLCKTRTIHDSMQAKCTFLHEGKEYNGILFAPGHEEWFTDLTEGSLVKAHRVGPCEDARYKGEYKGTALPLEQQPLELVYAPVKTESVVIDMALMPLYLREAAATIERLLIAASQKQEVVLPEPVKKEAPCRTYDQWVDITADVIKNNKRFHLEPFSTLNISSHISACFNDFWEGDLAKLSRGQPRWQPMVTKAMSILLRHKFIERVPGTQKHYRVTQHTLNQISDS